MSQQPVSSPVRYVEDLVNKKLNGRVFQNLYFFVNSVRFIVSILKKTGIKPDDVRVICANTDENRAKLEGYNIGVPSDNPCKVNFLTATCFEGCDILDENGITFIVSDGKNANTLYDISTMFVQIIGRIRNSDYKDKVMHIFSNTQYKGNVTCDEYRMIVENEYHHVEQEIREYNTYAENVRKFIFEKWGKSHWIDRFIHVDESYNF